MAHIDHVVLSSNFLKMQGDELWLVALDSLQMEIQEQMIQSAGDYCFRMEGVENQH